jgi:hypothetical protein
MIDRRRLATSALALLLATAAGGSVAARPWEREYLTLAPMQPDATPCERFDRNVEVYREGAAGANGGKSAGGCGCT